jgi:hypothetical protein
MKPIYPSPREPVFLWFLPLLLLTSCMSNRWVQTEIHKDKDVMVYLEHRLEDDQIANPGYDHPYAIDSRELSEIFFRLRYQKPRFFQSPAIESVFYKQEASNLAEHITKALALAKPWQRIRFASFNKGGGLLFAVRRKTEGVVFLEADNRLHIAFSAINRETDPTEIHDPEMDLSRRDPLKYRTVYAMLDPQPWLDIQYSEDQRKMMYQWAVVDLNRIREWYPRRAPPHREGTAAIPDKPEEMVKEKTPPGPPPEPEPVPVKETEEDSVKASLERLKEYYESGLIDEEEYTAKTKEILDKLE